MKARTPRLNDQTQRSRRGVMSMELAMLLPILMVILAGMFEFSLLFYARGDAIEAVRLGARFAAMPGATEDDVNEVVKRSLKPRLAKNAIVGVDWGEFTGEPVAVGVWIPTADIAPNLLWPIGFDLDDQRPLYAEAHAVME